MVENQERRGSPSEHLIGFANNKLIISDERGMGRRSMQELMSSDSSASLPNESLFQGRHDGLESHDIEKINFVRMLLALKMVKTDGEATPVPGMDNKLFLGSIGERHMHMTPPPFSPSSLSPLPSPVSIHHPGAAFNKSTLEKNKITHILCLCDGTRERFERDYKYFTCVTEDIPSYDIALKFIPCSDFIEDAIRGGGW